MAALIRVDAEMAYTSHVGPPTVAQYCGRKAALLSFKA